MPSDAHVRRGLVAIALLLAAVVGFATSLAASSRADAAATQPGPVAGRATAPQEGATLGPGATAIVRGDGDCLRVRTGPSLSSGILECIADGSTVLVLAGPTEADGYEWVQIQQASTTGWAASTFLEAVGAAPVSPSEEPPPVETPEPDGSAGSPPPAAAPAPTTLSGTIPVAGGIGLVVWGGDPAGLASELIARGCDFVSAWASNDQGGFVGYVKGAPELVNREWTLRFPDGSVPAGTPLAVVCRRGTAGAPAISIPGTPTDGTLRGVPQSGGVGLTVWGGTIESLASRAAQASCTFVSAWAAGSSGQLVGYVLGAPQIVNRSWLSEIGEPSVTDGTPLVIVCRRPAAAAPAAPASQEPSPGPTPEAPSSVPPDWRTRPPGPAGNE